ncbi:MAG: hypothetical protein E5V44_09125 [Mesorhizobium sp.]|nr:MAG: hypothetical protein E5V44_09125 [Mesorhizobium sp.]
MPRITTPARLDYFMNRVALADTLQMLVSAGVIVKADATTLCGLLARKARELDVEPDIEDYREFVASHFETIAESIV